MAFPSVPSSSHGQTSVELVQVPISPLLSVAVAADPDFGFSAGGTESKGEIGTWTSSTEVCPWEDEENRRESHAPFVKTYATLGYL
jgi:hypothetical protein